MFRPECRSVGFRRGGVRITCADTTVEATDAVESRLLVLSRCLSPVMPLPSEGQPIECAKFSMEGVTGLLWLASTRSRRLEARRARVLGVGEAASTMVTAGAGSSTSFATGDGIRAGADDLRGVLEGVLRFLRTVTFRMRSVFHSRSGISSTTWDPLSSSAPTVESTGSVVGKYGPCLFVGVTSCWSCSNARPSPRSSSTVLSLSLAGVAALLSSRSEEKGSSLAVWKESAREEEYVYIGGRSSVAVVPLVPLEALVRGGLGSGVGGLRALTGVLRDDFCDIIEFLTLSACSGCSGICAVLPSWEAVGGVGGRPLSAPGNAPGDWSGVLCSLSAIESVSSVACVV